jgi:CRP-like cAMP-binding protein
MRTSPSTVGTVERMLSLNRMPVLSGLAPEDLAVVAEQARERFFPTGSVLLREGEPVPALYAVLDGKVLLSRRDRTLGRVSAGGFVGADAMLARHPEGTSAVAQADTLTLEVEADAVLEIFEDHFPIFHHVLRESCRQLIDLAGRLPPGLYGSVFPQSAVARAPAADLDLVERILFLRQVSPFLHSSINALAELSRGMAEVVFPPGTRLWEEGESSGTVILVASGGIACDARGGEARFVLGPGAPMGAVESLAERRRWYTATSQTRVTALQGSIEALIDVFEDNFEMALAYLAVMARAQMRIIDAKVSASGRPRERSDGRAGAPESPPPAPSGPSGERGA